ncbi:hypothetical protein HID58_013429, partial [Brassica napus]
DEGTKLITIDSDLDRFYCRTKLISIETHHRSSTTDPPASFSSCRLLRDRGRIKTHHRFSTTDRPSSFSSCRLLRDRGRIETHHRSSTTDPPSVETSKPTTAPPPPLTPHGLSSVSSRAKPSKDEDCLAHHSVSSVASRLLRQKNDANPFGRRVSGSSRRRLVGTTALAHDLYNLEITFQGRGRCEHAYTSNTSTRKHNFRLSLR